MSPEDYRHLIAELTATVAAEGGRMRRMDAERSTARRLGISLADMQGIAVNARADRVLTYDLRADVLALPHPTGQYPDCPTFPHNWVDCPGDSIVDHDPKRPGVGMDRDTRLDAHPSEQEPA